MTQIKKPARRIFDAPIRLHAGVSQITRRFLFADTRVSNITRADIRAAIANDSAGSKVLFSCKENPVSESEAKAGALNPVADINGVISPRSCFEFFFCEKTPAFL